MSSNNQPILVLGFGEKTSKGNLVRERVKLEDALDEYSRDGIIDAILESNISIDSLVNEIYNRNIQNRVFGLYYSTDNVNDEILSAKYTDKKISNYLEKLASLKELRFVVLNGNASEQLAKRLLELGVPSVIGVSHKLNRFEASDFAEIFFKYIVETNDIERAFEETELKMLSYWGGRLKFEDKYWDDEISSPISNFQLPWKLFKNENTLLNEKWKDISFDKNEKKEVNAANLYFAGGSVGLFGLLAIILSLWLYMKEGTNEFNITGSILITGVFLIFLAGFLLFNTIKSKKKIN